MNEDARVLIYYIHSSVSEAFQWEKFPLHSKQTRREMSSAPVPLLSLFLKTNNFLWENQGWQTIPHVSRAKTEPEAVVYFNCCLFCSDFWRLIIGERAQRLLYAGSSARHRWALAARPAVLPCFGKSATINSIPGFCVLHERLCFLY